VRDTTVTIHPTVKNSTNIVLYLLSIDKKTSLGKIIEELLNESEKFKDAKKKYLS
jgi:hypothetical protein